MSSNKAILYISYDGMTDQLGQSQVLPYLAGLSQKGYNITLLSCEKPDKFPLLKTTIEAICAAAGINWHPIFYTSRPPVLSTIKDIAALRRHAEALHREHKFAIVHCRSYITALVGLHLKRKYQLRFLFDMRGFWADERVDGNLWNLRNPLYRIIYKYFKKKERVFLNEADHIISLTHAAKEELKNWDGLARQPLPLTVIPCCVDTALFDPSAIDDNQKWALLEKLNIAKEQMVVGYVGSIGTWYMLDEMLDYFKVLKQQHANAVMIFVTNEPRDMILTRLANAGLEEPAIRIIAAARKEVPLFISLMHHSIFFIRPCFSKKASSPTKQGEIMAMGIPVVCNARVGDTDFVVHKYNSGVVVNSFTAASYKDSFAKLAASSFDAVAIRQGAIEFYGLQKGIDLYAQVYHDLLNQD